MKSLLLLFFTSCALCAMAQQVRNVNAAQAGDNVLITYDLVDNSSRSYFVKVMMSKDGGVTFGNELRSVSGDVKQNVNPGTNKKIIWDAKQEIGSFAGDAVFKVEALYNTASMPAPVQNRCLKVELNEVKAMGAHLQVDFTLTPITSNCTVYLSAYVTNTYLSDSNNRKVKITDGFIAGTPKGQDKAALNGIPLRGYVTFDGVDSGASSIPQLTLYIGSLGGCHQDDATAGFTFTNVQASK